MYARHTMPAYKAYWFETYETRLMRLTHTISIGAEIVEKKIIQT